MIILGIDPGTIKLGYGSININDFGKIKLMFSGVISPGSNKSITDRLGVMLQDLELIISQNKPDVIALESSFYATNVRTVISLGEARGVILSLAGKYNIPVKEFAPTAIKQSIVGAGRADKDRVGKMVRMILNISKEFKDADESDALATALCYFYRVGRVETLAVKS